MSGEEYKQLIDSRDQALVRNVELGRALVEAKLDAGNGSTRDLVELLRCLLTCTRFAVGELPPETTKGWPSGDLKRAAELLSKMPDHTVDDISIASEFRGFIEDCERIGRYREELPKLAEFDQSDAIG